MHTTSCDRSIHFNVERFFMKLLKKSVAIIMILCMVLSFAGCSKTTYSNFDPSYAYLVDAINGETYEYEILSEEVVDEMWTIFQNLELEESDTAEKGEAYVLIKFYDKDENTIMFTIYNNGTCCLNRDYDVFYSSENGRSAYADLSKIFETYAGTNEFALINRSDKDDTSSTESSTDESSSTESHEQIVVD